MQDNNQKDLPNTTSVENNAAVIDDREYEFNSYANKLLFDSIFNCSIYDYFNKDVIKEVINDPVGHYEDAIMLSQLVYNKNGVVSNSIDYCTSLMTLDRIITSESKNGTALKNRKLMHSTLKCINDKHFIRDALYTQMLTGIAFYYFEVRDKKFDRKKFLSDYDIDMITEINSLGINASIITLPWQYTRIVGTVNDRFVLAFNLRYFDDYVGDTLERKLKKYPTEIVEAYHKRTNNISSDNWYVLNPDNTMCRKIKAKDNEPWGRSLVIAALADVLYKDYWVDTKRNTLDEINSRIVYETFPANKTGNGSSLTKAQQEAQHNVVKGAIQNRSSKNGVAFFSLAAGTQMDTLDVSTDIFDDKNESSLNNDIAVDIGVSAALIGAMTTGTYSGNITNLEMITAELYSWICEWKEELVHVINANIIKDKNNPVDIYYFPTSFVNRKEFFEMMKGLYTDAAGSIKFLIASTGVDPDTYLSVMQDEVDEKIFDKFKPHQTSYTISSNNTGGRPTTDNPSENTVRSNNNGGNNLPSPSDT